MCQNEALCKLDLEVLIIWRVYKLVYIKVHLHGELGVAHLVRLPLNSKLDNVRSDQLICLSKLNVVKNSMDNS